MSGQWKPGDVAMVTAYNRRTEYRAYFDGKTWREHEHDMFCVDRPMSHRPLVVIDPEDREQVERLYLLIQQAYTLALRSPGGPVPDLATALREVANPTPPKPEEPTGLGAVVEDEKGNRWVSRGDGYMQSWVLAHRDGVGGSSSWSEIAVVKVLSEGVTP